LERELIEAVMRECGGTKVTAALRLGINRNTLHKKWEEYRAQKDRDGTLPDGDATRVAASDAASAAGDDAR
jgi:Nif-specific regulatory protein